jgi:hypothetical protein
MINGGLKDDPPIPDPHPILDKYVTPWDDHINVTYNDFSVNLMRTKFYTDRLDNSTLFDGFFPRWYLPQTTMYGQDLSTGE